MNPEHVIPQLLVRSWPFPRGAGRIIDRYFRKLPFSSQQATVETTDGFHLTISPNDLIGRHIYLSGEFDRTTAEVLINFAEPGDTLLDVGANIGYMTACFLQNVPGSTAVAIEPQPGIVDLCGENLAQFGARVSIAPIAISDISGHLPFVIEPENCGRSRLAGSDEEATINVPVQSATEFFLESNLTKLDLVKIDVEGHEDRILAASAPFINSLQPKVILYEDHGGEQTRTGQVGAIFRDLGYSSYGVKKHLTRVALQRNFYDTNDYAAVSSKRAIPTKAKLTYSLPFD